MADLTPTQLAIVRALVGADWDKGVSATDIGSREDVAAIAQDVEAAARPLIEAEVREQIADQVSALRVLALEENDDALWAELERRADEAGWPVESIRRQRRRESLSTLSIKVAYQIACDFAADAARGGVRNG